MVLAVPVVACIKLSSCAGQENGINQVITVPLASNASTALLGEAILLARLVFTNLIAAWTFGNMLPGAKCPPLSVLFRLFHGKRIQVDSAVCNLAQPCQGGEDQ